MEFGITLKDIDETKAIPLASLGETPLFTNVSFSFFSIIGCILHHPSLPLYGVLPYLAGG